jgi:outer membrane protein
LQAQKYACVNTDYVLRSVPDYANAQKRLDKYVEDWQKELVDKQAEVDALRAEFEQESYLLPDNLKKRRQEELKTKEQEIRALQQQRFGAGGDLDKKRAELLKPVQDRVYATIERLAQEKNYAFVFDKAGSSAVLFANKKYDISDEVLEMLGYKSGASAEPAGAGESSKKPTNPEMRGRDSKRDKPNTDKSNKENRRNK